MKPSIPDTRNSLIFRLPNSGDGGAWEEFMAIYEPQVYRLARSKGFQDADAREIVQEVMVSVSGVVNRWTPDPEKGRFRDFLFRIAPGFALVKQFPTPARLGIPGGTNCANWVFNWTIFRNPFFQWKLATIQ